MTRIYTIRTDAISMDIEADSFDAAIAKCDEFQATNVLELEVEIRQIGDGAWCLIVSPDDRIMIGWPDS